MWFDCHVHCRDWEQFYKETIAHALEVAEDSNLSGIIDMPNTNPIIITEQEVRERLNLAKAVQSSVFYGLYMGLTSNPAQIEQAVQTHEKYFPRFPETKTGVIGFKMFAGKSVGDLTIIEEEKQKLVYEILVKHNYKGVLFVHCEKESEMIPDLWNPNKPWTHSDAHPEIAEIESIKDQIKFAKETKYQGHLHIVHVSTPESVELVQNAKNYLNISCGVTPHHLLFDTIIMESGNGILYKVNPPLRSPETREKLFELFKSWKIDILESDHAPHIWREKFEKPYMSGIPGLASWPKFISLLKKLGVTQSLLDKVAFENVNQIFGLQIPRLDLPTKSHIGDYVFNPYGSLK